MRTSAPDFPKKLDVVRTEGLPPSNNQVEWLGRGTSEGMLVITGVLNPPTLAGQNAGKQLIDFAAGWHD
jgi:hypothetical protein